VKDIPETDGPILVTLLHLLPEDELQSVLAYRNGSSVLIGRMTERVSRIETIAQWRIGCEVNGLFCVTRDRSGEVVDAFAMEHNADYERQEERRISGFKEGMSWLDSLYFSPVSEAFLSKCVEGIIERTNVPKALKNEAFIRAAVLEMAPCRWRILISNLHMNYKSAHLDAGRPIDNITVLTDFPGVPVHSRGSEFSLYYRQRNRYGGARFTGGIMKQQWIDVQENGIYLNIEITDSGDVRLLHFSASPSEEEGLKAEEERRVRRIVELQLTGEDQNDHHAAKYTGTMPGGRLTYVSHRDFRNSDGRKFEITMGDRTTRVTVHYQFYDGISVIRSWTEVANGGKESLPLQYVLPLRLRE